MGKSLPERLKPRSLTTSYHSSYVPLVQVAGQLCRAAMVSPPSMRTLNDQLYIYMTTILLIRQGMSTDSTDFGSCYA